MSPTLLSLIASNFTSNITNATRIYEIPRVEQLPQVNLSADSIPDVNPNWNIYGNGASTEQGKRRSLLYSEHSGPGDYPLCCNHEVENMSFFVDCKFDYLRQNRSDSLQVGQSPSRSSVKESTLPVPFFTIALAGPPKEKRYVNLLKRHYINQVDWSVPDVKQDPFIHQQI